MSQCITPDVMEDLSDHTNVYKTYRLYIGAEQVNREDEPETFSERNLRETTMNTNIEGVAENGAGRRMGPDLDAGVDQTQSRETIEKVERKGSQTFHEDYPLNYHEVPVFEHSVISHVPDRDSCVFDKLKSYTNQSNDVNPNVYVPPAHDQPQGTSVGTSDTNWIVTDALINVRGSFPENKYQLPRGTPSLNSIQITKMKVKPRPPSRNKEVNAKRKRSQIVHRHDTEQDTTIKKDGEIADDDIKGNKSKVDDANSKQESVVNSVTGDRLRPAHDELDSQLLDEKERYKDEDGPQTLSSGQNMSPPLVTTPTPMKTPRPEVSNTTQAKHYQITKTLFRTTSGAPDSGPNKPQPSTSCLKSMDRAMKFEVRHPNPAALRISRDIYNAYARVTVPRRPLPRQSSFPGEGQCKPFISIYDRPFSRRELRRALPRKSFFSCHDKALKDAGLMVTDSPTPSKPSRRNEQLEHHACESTQSHPKVPYQQTPDNCSQQIVTGLEENKNRTSPERSHEVDAPKEGMGTPAIGSEEIISEESKEFFHSGESEVTKSVTPMFKKRKPQSAKSHGVDCTPLTKYLEYIKENHQEFIRYQESLKQESATNTRLIKLGQVYELRHQGGVAREGCDDILVKAAKTLRPRSEKVNGLKEPLVRSAGSYRKPSRVNFDDRRLREKTPGPSVSGKDDESGTSELEKRKVKAEAWAWSVSTHTLAKAKLQSLRELGSDDRELTAWWEVFKDCQYLRNVRLD